MRVEYPLYEGDGIIHAPLEIRSAFADPIVDLSEIEKFARESRARALAGLITRFLDWVDASIQRAKYRELEDYLSKSTDLADLERRMRRIEDEPRNMLPTG